MTALDFDIIVVGGGVAGAACAALLAGQHRRIALIDARRPDCAAMPEDFDLRVVALSPGSQQILDAAGAWSKIPVERLASYRKMSVHADAQGVDFRAADHGLQELGWIAEIPILEKALWQRLASLDSVSLFAPVTWKTADLGAETVRLTLDDGRVLRAALLVAADGGRSRLRQQAEIRVDEWHYNQRALIAPVTTEQPNRDQAWQRFTEHGPLALLPLPDGRSSIVWSQAGGRAEQLAEMPADDFIAEI